MPLQVPFAADIGCGEADPEGDAEELPWFEVRETRGGEEDSHDWPRGGDAQQDGDGAHHPLAVERLVAQEERKRSHERKQEQPVEDDDGG